MYSTKTFLCLFSLEIRKCRDCSKTGGTVRAEQTARTDTDSTTGENTGDAAKTKGM